MSRRSLRRSEFDVSMVNIRPMNDGDFLLLRKVRLRALTDAPLAFASTYQRESALGDDDWRKRARSWAREGMSQTLLAFDGDDACCGIVAAFMHRQIAARACVVSMWVAPAQRRRGIACRLLDQIEDWARQREAREIVLDVNEMNPAAIALYRRCGYSFTGHSWPYPNDPSLRELEMIKPLGSPPMARSV